MISPSTPSYRRLLRGMALLLLSAALAGCAAAITAYRHGQDAERREDWDRAVIEYVKALAQSPGNTRYSVALARARLRASAVHFERGKAYQRAGQLELAGAEFEQTILLDSSNQYAVAELGKTRETLRKLSMSPSEIELAKVRAKKKSLAPPKLSPKSNLPIVLKFKDQPVGKIYDALSKASGVNFLYDDRVDLKETKTVDIAGVTFERAMEILMLQFKHFYTIIDENTIIIAQENRQKRQEYEPRVIQTFYLSNGDTKQVNTVLRQLLDARKVAENPELNSLTVRDSPDMVAVAQKIIEANDKAKAELIIDIELLELNTTKLREFGLDLTSKALTLLFEGGGVSVPLNNLKHVNQQSSWTIGPVPGFALSFAKTFTDSKVIAKPQLRVTEGEKAEIHIGDRVPIPSTTFNTSNTVGGNIIPITSFTYQNVGIQISIEPRVHHNKEITLKLNVEVSSLAGSIQGTGGVSQPIIGTRTIQTVIRLKDGETNLLAGLIREEDRRDIGGVPGLTDIPILNRIFGKNSDTSQNTDIVLTITPHVIRVPDITEEDMEPVWVGTEEQVKLRIPPNRSPYGESPFMAQEGEAPPAEGAVAAGATTPGGEAPAGNVTVTPSEGQQPPRTPSPTPSAEQPQARQVAPQPGEEEEEDLGEEEDFEEEEPAEEGTAPQPPTSLAQVILSTPKTAFMVGEQVPVEVRVVSAQNVGSIPFHLRYNPQVLDYVGPAVEGDFLRSDGAQTVFIAQPSGPGEIVVGVSRVGSPNGANGGGTVVTFNFVAKGAGPANFTFTGAAVKDPNANNMPAQFNIVPVTVQGK